MLTQIQILLFIFVLFAASRVILRFREKVISTKTALFWVIIWSSAAAGILLPQTTTRIASYFGIGRGVDVIVYVALAILFYLVFRIYVMVEDLRHEITFLVREMALKNTRKKSRK